MTLRDSDLGPLSRLPSLSGPGRAGRLWRRILRRLSHHWALGELTIELPGGEKLVFAAAEMAADAPRALLRLHRWRAVRRLLFSGELGFAEAFIEGDWSSPDLPGFLGLMDNNAASLASVRGLALARLLARLRHLARRNTKRGSRRNIAAHYDLGNDFYACWLDRDMSYSSAIYRDSAMSLEQAQAAKQARILELLELSGGESILEIGCGWGGLAEAMLRRGAGVTALTLSPAQRDYARARLADAGDRVAVRLQDYRDVSGSYDRIVSVEMIEAVGEENWPIYFRCLRDRLKPDGTAVLQAITLEESRFDTYRSGTDFIQRYIFPGGMLPTRTVMRREAARVGLVCEELETFAASYARTLAAWNERFQAAWPNIAALGYSDRFHRLWTYYLAYCRAGFTMGGIDVGLYRLRRES